MIKDEEPFLHPQW